MTRLRYLPLAALALMLLFGTLHAQTFTSLHDFNNSDGALPSGRLVQDTAGNLYGTTEYGGNTSCASGCGTIFKISASGQVSLLHEFLNNSDGYYPRAGLTVDAKGNAFGTTRTGGNQNCVPPYGCGVVFKVNKAAESTLFAFNGTDGNEPLAELLAAPGGVLYGTTFSGGVNGVGTVFQVNPDGSETLLYSFGLEPDGETPEPPLVRDGSGNLFGTTSQGGLNNNPVCLSGCGTVFELSPVSGGWQETVLYRFTGEADGADSMAGLVRDPQGALYGSTVAGGDKGDCLGGAGCGVIFKLTPGVSGWTETVLYTFTGGTDGSAPMGTLVRNAAGDLFGTTSVGGNSSCNAPIGCGTVFKLSSKGTFSVLHSFSGTDGDSPSAALYLNHATGTLYGTTDYGGNLSCSVSFTTPGCGTVFKITQ